MDHNRRYCYTTGDGRLLFSGSFYWVGQSPAIYTMLVYATLHQQHPGWNIIPVTPFTTKYTATCSGVAVKCNEAWVSVRGFSWIQYVIILTLHIMYLYFQASSQLRPLRSTGMGHFHQVSSCRKVNVITIGNIRSAGVCCIQIGIGKVPVPFVVPNVNCIRPCVPETDWTYGTKSLNLVDIYDNQLHNCNWQLLLLIRKSLPLISICILVGNNKIASIEGVKVVPVTLNNEYSA